MKRVTITELKARLSYHLRTVEAGTEIEVTVRNRPIARIVPIEGRPRSVLRPPERPFAEIRDRRYPQANWAVDSVDLLLEERQDR